jgi:predicted nucleic acid-binding Zn ribbon protein
MAETPVVDAPIPETHCCYCEWTEHVVYQNRRKTQRRNVVCPLFLAFTLVLISVIRG